MKKSKDYLKMTDIYKHLLKGLEGDLLSLKDQQKIDDFIVNICGKNLHKRNVALLNEEKYILQTEIQNS